MNDELILALGSFCKETLDAEAFQAMQHLFSQQLVADFMKTAPHETKAREQLYASNMGYLSFVGLLQHTAAAFEKLMADTAPPDQLDIIDDPAVHDIYNEE